MNRNLVVLEEEIRRFAFHASPRVVASLIPRGVRGVYLLLVGRRPLYVGRSDTCLRVRLTQHSLLSRATHLTWAPCSTEVDAFRLESAMYHSLSIDEPNMLNRIHPAAPAGGRVLCPFCEPSTRKALARALKTVNEINRKQTLERI